MAQGEERLPKRIRKERARPLLIDLSKKNKRELAFEKIF
jgi:hypothetical protein